MATDDPAADRLIARLTKLLPDSSSFEGIVYRSSTPRYASEKDLLTGIGSQHHGGRWNRIGIAVVYASLTPEVAMAETLAQNRYYGIALEEAMPRTFVAIHAKLSHVLDLTLGSNRKRLQVSLENILHADWRKEVRAGRIPLTQLLGHAATRVGLEGLIVPSAASVGGVNLVIIPENLGAGSTLEIANKDRLYV